jgi:hypothetical protein
MTSPVIQADPSDARNTASGDIRDATEPAERRLPSQNGAGATLNGPRGYIAFGGWRMAAAIRCEPPVESARLKHMG